MRRWPRSLPDLRPRSTMRGAPAQRGHDDRRGAAYESADPSRQPERDLAPGPTPRCTAGPTPTTRVANSVGTQLGERHARSCRPWSARRGRPDPRERRASITLRAGRRPAGRCACDPSVPRPERPWPRWSSTRSAPPRRRLEPLEVPAVQVQRVAVHEDHGESAVRRVVGRLVDLDVELRRRRPSASDRRGRRGTHAEAGSSSDASRRCAATSDSLAEPAARSRRPPGRRARPAGPTRALTAHAARRTRGTRGPIRVTIS